MRKRGLGRFSNILLVFSLLFILLLSSSSIGVDDESYEDYGAEDRYAEYDSPVSERIPPRSSYTFTKIRPMTFPTKIVYSVEYDDKTERGTPSYKNRAFTVTGTDKELLIPSSVPAEAILENPAMYLNKIDRMGRYERAPYKEYGPLFYLDFLEKPMIENKRNRQLAVNKIKEKFYDDLRPYYIEDLLEKNSQRALTEEYDEDYWFYRALDNLERLKPYADTKKIEEYVEQYKSPTFQSLQKRVPPIYNPYMDYDELRSMEYVDEYKSPYHESPYYPGSDYNVRGVYGPVRDVEDENYDKARAITDHGILPDRKTKVNEIFSDRLN